MNREVSFFNLDAFESNFKGNKANLIAQNAVIGNGINNVAKNYYAKANNLYAFSVEVDVGKVTNQKQSGRCWMFASYNVMRLEVMKRLNLGDFELSQNYPLFFDKLEKSNHFLENIIENIDEKPEGRLLSFLLMDPVGDGGQWDMFRSLVYKYGVVPKDIMPETSVSSMTRELNSYITKKLRGYACALQTMAKEGKSIEELRAAKEEMLETIYRMLSIALGTPPKSFTWETRDKDGKFIRMENVTPVQFFNEYVGWNLDEYVTVINAPTKDKPYGKTFTVQCLGNVREGRYPVKYLNLPMDDLRDLTIRQLKDGKAVWFGSDVGQFSDRKEGFLTMDAYNVSELFDTTFPMTKEQRLDYGDSLMTHAMVITGVDLDENGKPIRWKVENSWGDEVGNKGYFVMDDRWFGEFSYQILLEKDYLSEEQKAQLEQEPIVLKPWDPMGSLAL